VVSGNLNLKMIVYSLIVQSATIKKNLTRKFWLLKQVR
jgi:hypothetical protein